MIFYFTIISTNGCVVYTILLFLYIAQLNEVNPKVGPQSGGTRLYLTGSNLNIGSNIEIFLDELPCRVERYSHLLINSIKY
jgi:hypothetical protein